jgi:CheY-like chemotaxis protein
MPHPGHVMVVEDEPTLRVILTTLLSDAGHQVTPVANAEDALAALSTTAVDAILTDKNLPGLHGLALAQKARALRPGVRIILITGYPSVGAASEALEAGILGFLVKPLRQLTEVADELARVLTLPDPAARLARTHALRARLRGEPGALPPLSALFISDRAELKVWETRLAAPHTARARDLHEAQLALAKTRFSAVLGTDLAALIAARGRLPDAAMILLGDASFADVLECIRLGALVLPIHEVAP